MPKKQMLSAGEFIRENYGAEYTSEQENDKKNAGKIQDAHEAIRPTNIALTPVMVKESLPGISSVFIS